LTSAPVFNKLLEDLTNCSSNDIIEQLIQLSACRAKQAGCCVLHDDSGRFEKKE
jgi:hypothetical protein